jgi:outer membrane protein TolC
MTFNSLVVTLLATSVMMSASPSFAQSQVDSSQADAKTAQLKAQIEALQKQLDALKAQVTKVTPRWKGAPQFADEKAGWSFKPLDASNRYSVDGVAVRAQVDF